MNPDLRFDYTTVGHVTIDVLADGARRAGGTAFYSALQAARLGQRTLVITQGVEREIEELIEPYMDELDIEIHLAPATTTLRTSGAGASREQRVLAWAGRMPDDLRIDSAILHLAPIAREGPAGWGGRTGFVGLTPQGMARAWRAAGEEIFLAAPVEPAATQLARTADALVLSEQERASCAAMIASAREAGATVAVTAGAAPTRILLAGGGSLALEVAPVDDPGDDLGAGDVFAAAFFVALSEGQTPERAASFAAAAATVRMNGEGPNAIGDHAAIAARM